MRSHNRDFTQAGRSGETPYGSSLGTHIWRTSQYEKTGAYHKGSRKKSICKVLHAEICWVIGT